MEALIDINEIGIDEESRLPLPLRQGLLRRQKT